MWMLAAPTRDGSVFQQIFAEHWEPFQQAHPRYQTPYYAGLVAKMLACGQPAQIGYSEYRCLDCGQGTHVVALSCKSSRCLRCAKVYVDNWVSQVSHVLHEGGIYRHIILTVPAMFRTTFYQNAAGVLSAFRYLAEQFEENCYVKRILRGLPCVPTRWPFAPDDIETAYTAVVVHTVWIAIPVWRIIRAAAVIVPVDLFERNLIGH